MKNRSLTFIRLLFTILCVLFMTTYSMSGESDKLDLTHTAIGLFSGISVALLIISMDLLLKRFKLRSFNIAVVGLFIGYLMGKAILLIADVLLDITQITFSAETSDLFKTILFLASSYLGLILTVRSSEELYLSLPFIKLKISSPKRKDILLDSSVLTDSRIIDIASSGLLDDQIIIPRFMIRELYLMLENADENIKTKAKRCLEVLRKLESIPTLELRYSDTDFQEIKEPAHKLIHLSRMLDTNILTADAGRLQPYVIEGVRIINLHMLSNALKPMVTGENINIKIQRYGKEPRQGVGYLDDGTMVVINGGAEYIGETIKAQVLSVKHTSTGRMIFCNVMDDAFLMDVGATAPTPEMEDMTKNYFAL